MFVQQQETTESVKLLCHAVDWLAKTYFGKGLSPGVGIFDHSDGFMNGLKAIWDGIGTSPRYQYVSYSNSPYRPCIRRIQHVLASSETQSDPRYDTTCDTC